MRFPEARFFVEHPLAYEILQDLESGIVAFAVGRKHGGAITEGTPEYFCVSAFVLRKLPIDEPARGRTIAAYYTRCSQAAQQMPVRMDRDDLRVVEALSNVQLQAYSGSSHSIPATINMQKWFAELRPGISIVNPVGSYPTTLDAGTISFFVKAENNEDIYLVSCNHVIARQRTSSASGVPAEVIIQPGTMDLSGRDITEYLQPNDLITPFGVANLTAFVDVVTHVRGAASPHSNTADAAMARLTDSRTPHYQLSRLPYGGRFRGKHDFEWDEPTETIKGSAFVFKCGRTTGYTEGLVTDVKGVACVAFANGLARFTDQLVIAPTRDNTGKFSEPGDSGSPVVTEKHKVAGMIIAGTAKQSWATPVHVVLSKLANALDNSGNTTLDIIL